MKETLVFASPYANKEEKAKTEHIRNCYERLE